MALQTQMLHAGACAEEAKQEIDTQFIFGFTAGADVGELGEMEIEHETIARLGKRGGSYIRLSGQTRAEFVPVQNLRLELGRLVFPSSTTTSLVRRALTMCIGSPRRHRFQGAL